MYRTRPTWQTVCFALAAIAAAGVLGYSAENNRLRYRQFDELTRLSEALRQTSGLVADAVQNAVRAPGWAASRDTLYFVTAEPIVVQEARQPDSKTTVWFLNTDSTDAPRLWTDSTCNGSGVRVHHGRSVAVEATMCPTRLWSLEHHALYVDKSKGGLWVRHGSRPPERLAQLVDQFCVEPDSSTTAGFSLGLSGTWQVTEATTVRRSVYRYVPPEERWEG